MRLVIFGGSGIVGQRIVDEARRRGHQVTAVSRHGPDVTADVTDPAQVAAVVRGQDAVISAVGPGHSHPQPPDLVVRAAHGLVEGLRRAGVRRLVILGGAGSLEVAPGQQLVDTPTFPEAWRPIALAHRDALDVYRDADDLDWTYISPAALLEPGSRRGTYRLGGDQLMVDADGQSHISAEDFAIAVLDQVEHPTAIRKRITAGY